MLRRLQQTGAMIAKAALQCLVVYGTTLYAVGHAQEQHDFPEEKPWAEAEFKLPPYPKPANLIQFVPALSSSSRFYIDPESISTAGDGVVRYTLVVKGAGGAENVSYEGMRCRTLEVKHYAYGRSNGSWTPARVAEWRRLDTRNPNLHRVLFWDYFCPDRLQWGNSPQDAINRFRNGIAPREAARQE